MNILIADDEKGIQNGLSRLFSREGFGVFAAGDYDQALKIVRENEIQAALIDIRLGSGDGTALLKEIMKTDQDTVCIMITGYASINSAVEAMRLGAADYLMKPLDNTKLLQSVRSRIEIRKLRHENSFLRSELENMRDRIPFLFRDPRMGEIRELADRVKDTDVTILVGGESGTGKEVLSRYIHETGNRKDFPFVGVNCAALSETLLLSELFGHEKGAFTGAQERKIGKIELADKGTLFLDEIGDMSLDAQAKLLRVIEEGTFERVGGNRPVKADFRLIAATNRDLSALVASRQFRQDLYYRLKVITFHLPPLRERREDIPLLADYFCDFFCRKYRKDKMEISPENKETMKKCSWPGNVRELRNMINQAVLLSSGSSPDLSPYLLPAEAEPEFEPALIPEGSLHEQLEILTEKYERKILSRALEETRFNKTEAAQKLGISRKTLFNKLMKYNMA